MISITSTQKPATDLGYLLHKNPARVHDIGIGFGRAIVAFPEASETRCTATVLVELDPIRLVRSRSGALSQYVNDRPYVASSFLCTTLSKAFGTAMSGRCKDRPDLAEIPLDLEVNIPVIAARCGADGIQRLFVPLGYSVEATNIVPDPMHSDSSASDYYSLKLSARLTVQELLHHLYVLLPVLDTKKHYFMDSQEVKKLIDKGGTWLHTHPEKEWIVRSYLGRMRSLVREALEQLANIEPDLEGQEQPVDVELVLPDGPDEPLKKRLHEQRHDRVIEIVSAMRPKSVVDLGCGDGRLLARLIPILGLNRIVGMDVSYYELEKASRRLRLSEASPKLRERVELIHGSLTYRDQRLEGFDVATAVEVIEHLDVARLQAFERVVFECARPGTVIITTPNREYNTLYEGLERFRHEDHRFEWSRIEFQDWASQISQRFGYQVEFESLGDIHESYGSPSQMAVFTR